MGKPSVTYQINEALKAIFTPGVGRHKLKARGLADRRIVSIGTMQDYVRSCSRFARWCKGRYGVRDIHRITPEMAQRYIDELHDKELSGGYIGREKAAIRKLDTAMKHIGLRPNDAPPLLEKRESGWHSDRHPERAYTPKEAEQIINDMRKHSRDKQTADVAQLQYVAGLRVTEAVMIRGKDIDPETCVLHVELGSKGGRPRTVQMDKKHRPFLLEITARAERNRDGHAFHGRGRLGTSLAQRTADAVRCACERLGTEHYATHGFRKCWAQKRHKGFLEQGVEERVARQVVAKELGHNRSDVTYSYIPR